MDQEIVDDPAFRDEIIDGLKSIPTFSIVMDPEELWPQTGLYIDSDRHGRASERPISLEIIEPGGELGIQLDAGIRNHGNRTRDFDVDTEVVVFVCCFRGGIRRLQTGVRSV